MASLPISGIVSVQVVLTPQQQQAPAINTMRVIGTSTVIDAAERERFYDSLTAVATDFGTAAPEYIAASRWFGQSPQPNGIYIGRWVNVASAGQLIGGPITAANQLISAWNAVSSGSFSIIVDGIPYAVTGMNFSSATNLNGVALIIQTALRTATGGTQTVVYNSTYNNFVVTDSTTGTTSVIGFIAPPRGIGSAAFSGQPTAADTLTIDGTVVTFVSGSPSGNQVQIGLSLTATLASLLSFLNGSTDANLSLMNYFVVGSTLYIQSKLTGTAGNAYTLAKASTAITLSGATLSGGTGTDISAMTAATQTSSGAYQAPGLAAETALAAVTLFDAQFGGQAYGLTLLGGVDTDYEAIAAYIEGVAPAHYHGITTQEGGVLVSTSTTDLAYVLAQLVYNHTAIQYSSYDPYAVVSYLARILSTNWLGSNTAITLMFKQEPGVTPEQLNSQQAAVAKSKNCNYYAYRGSAPEIENGVSCSGQFTDLIVGADWLAGQVMTAVFNAMAGTPTKIPQTDAGMGILCSAAAGSCKQAVTNGYLAPGVWNAPGFGPLNTGDNLTLGYFVWAPSMATQSEAVRQTRAAPVMQIAAKTAGAIQSASVIININQ